MLPLRYISSILERRKIKTYLITYLFSVSQVLAVGKHRYSEFTNNLPLIPPAIRP